MPPWIYYHYEWIKKNYDSANIFARSQLVSTHHVTDDSFCKSTNTLLGEKIEEIVINPLG